MEIVTKNWIVEVNDISGGRYSIKNKRFKTSMLMENLKRFNLLSISDNFSMNQKVRGIFIEIKWIMLMF